METMTKRDFGGLARPLQRDRLVILSLTTTTRRALAIAFFAIGMGLSVGQAAETPAKDDAKSAARENAKKAAASSGEQKKAIEEAVKKERDITLAEYEKLKKQYSEASEEQKKQIREKIEEKVKALEEVTAAYHKQLRDEQRKQRAGAAKR